MGNDVTQLTWYQVRQILGIPVSVESFPKQIPSIALDSTEAALYTDAAIKNGALTRFERIVIPSTTEEIRRYYTFPSSITTTKPSSNSYESSSDQAKTELAPVYKDDGYEYVPVVVEHKTGSFAIIMIILLSVGVFGLIAYFVVRKVRRK